MIVSEHVNTNHTALKKINLNHDTTILPLTICHDLSVVVYDLNDFMILNIKGVDYRCCVLNMSKNDAINLLNNSMLDNKRLL